MFFIVPRILEIKEVWNIFKNKSKIKRPWKKYVKVIFCNLTFL